MFKIRKGTMEDVCKVREIMEITHGMLSDKSWYSIDGTQIDWLVKNVEEDGFTLIAEVNGVVAGFLVVHYPKDNSENLCNYFSNDSINEMDVVHMETSAVLPQFRGRGLQRILMERAEEMLPENIKYSMCTINPDNYPSYCNVVKCGYTFGTDATEEYTKSQRFIMVKQM